MLARVGRNFHEALFAPLREAAKQVAGGAVEDGMKQFLTRWADNTYEKGTSIEKLQDAEAFAETVRFDISAFTRQDKIAHMYEDFKVAQPNE